MSKQEAGGVPWDKIFDETDRGRSEGTVAGRSGLDLKYAVSKTEQVIKFSVADALDPQLFLSSYSNLPKNYFGLWLSTRGFQGDENIRHPDMHARKFVGDALEIFNKRYGIDPNYFVGSWIDESDTRDNFEIFWKHYKINRDAVAAASQTWTAKAIKVHNFTDIQEKDVIVDEQRGIVTANFWRRR